VAGALLPGAIAPSAATGDATGTAAADSSGTAATGLVVRISRADPGACTAADPATGERCGSREDGTYLAADGPAGPTAYAYGNGDEVAIGGSADTGAVPGLTAEQLAAAARAVLGALG
jgi:hypothetical protein